MLDQGVSKGGTWAAVAKEYRDFRPKNRSKRLVAAIVLNGNTGDVIELST